MKRTLSAAVLAVLVVAGSLVGPTPVYAGDRSFCTAKCGGHAGGEAANSPKVVACFRGCMGTNDNSDGVATRKGARRAAN